MYRWLVPAAVFLVLGVAGCQSGSSLGASPPPASSSASSSAASQSASGTPAAQSPAVKTGQSTAGTGSGSLRLLVEPAAGTDPIYQLIAGARKSVDLTMYELQDQTAEDDLAADAARGVDVRVLLDQNLERSRNEAAYSFLSAHGVHVAWATAGTTYHQKTLTVDDATSVIMTLNMVTEGYPDTRDFAVIDTQPADVAAIVATFNADFAGSASTPPDGDDLVWSPTNSQSTILSVINDATRTLAVENEEMDDSTVTAALASAAQRGVDVQVVMTADSEWDDAFAQLAAAGVHVHVFPDSSSALYIHAKAIVADAGQSDEQAFVGSENFSVASLDYNRELGIVTTNAALVSAVSATIAADYSASGTFTTPAPASPTGNAASSTPAAAGGLCGAPSNPFGLTLCAGGQLVYSPPSGVCDYFNCIDSFDDGKGYMEECADGTYSMSGGRDGVCTDHGGPSRPVYQE